MKILPAVLMLACAPLAVGNSNPGYPGGKLARFVLEKLDVTTLPQELRPGHAKGKKTLEQYSFVPVAITESEAVLRNAAGPSEIVIRILEQRGSGIYVCARHRQNGTSNADFQRVLLLEQKGANGLLKGKESYREFASCPDIGGDDDLQTRTN